MTIHRVVLQLREEDVERIDDLRRRTSGSGVPSRAQILRAAIAALAERPTPSLPTPQIVTYGPPKVGT